MSLADQLVSIASINELQGFLATNTIGGAPGLEATNKLCALLRELASDVDALKQAPIALRSGGAPGTPLRKGWCEGEGSARDRFIARQTQATYGRQRATEEHLRGGREGWDAAILWVKGEGA